jgi:hypothetical protein
MSCGVPVDGRGEVSLTRAAHTQRGGKIGQDRLHQAVSLRLVGSSIRRCSTTRLGPQSQVVRQQRDMLQCQKVTQPMVYQCGPHGFLFSSG